MASWTVCHQFGDSLILAAQLLGGHWRLLFENAFISGSVGNERNAHGHHTQHLTTSSDEMVTVDLHLACTIWKGWKGRSILCSNAKISSLSLLVVEVASIRSLQMSVINCLDLQSGLVGSEISVMSVSVGCNQNQVLMGRLLGGVGECMCRRGSEEKEEEEEKGKHKDNDARTSLNIRSLVRLHANMMKMEK